MLKSISKIIKGLCFVALMAQAVGASTQVIYVSKDPYLVKGEVAYRAGQYKLAIEYFTKGLKKSLTEEQIVFVQNAVCAAEYALVHYTKAVKHCSIAIDIDSKYWMAYVNRGNAYKALGNEHEAHADYCKARQLKPKMVSNKVATGC